MMSLCIDNTSSSSFHSSCSSTSFSTQSAYLQQNKNGIQKPHKMQMQRNHHHNHKHVQEATSNYSRYTNVISTIDHNTFHSPSPNTYIKKENHSLTTSLSTSSVLNNESNSSHNNTCVSLEVQEPYQQPTTSSSTCRGNQQQQLNSNCNQLTVCWKKVLSPQGSSSFKEKKMQSYLEMAKVRKHRVISEKEMIQVLHLSQQQACKLLGCSLSTLKRRFYELKDVLGLKRWPQYFHDIRHLPIFNKLYPMSLQFILNEENSSSALHSDHVIPSCDELFNNSIPNI